MRKSSKSFSEDVAELIIFYDENNSQSSIEFGLQHGENLIGKNAQKCQVICRFSSEIDDVNTKITIDDNEEFSIEDQGSKRGTFKIKSDNSLIRLKPYQSYQLDSPQDFYIGRYRCVFRYLSNGCNSGVNEEMVFSPIQTQINMYNGFKGEQDVDDEENENEDDDIEDYNGLPSMVSRNSVKAKLPLNAHFEVQEFDEEHEMELIKRPSRMILNTQKIFSSARERLGRSYKGVFKGDNDYQQSNIERKSKGVVFAGVNTINHAESISSASEIEENQVANELIDSLDEEDEMEFEMLKKSHKAKRGKSKNNTVAESKQFLGKKQRSSSQIIHEMEEEERNLKLDSNFLKRIEERLKNSKITSSGDRNLCQIKANKQKVLSQDIEMESQSFGESELSEDEVLRKPSRRTQCLLVKKRKVDDHISKAKQQMQQQEEEEEEYNQIGLNGESEEEEEEEVTCKSDNYEYDNNESDSIIETKRKLGKKKKAEKIEKKQTDKLKKVGAAAENLELEENKVLIKSSMTKKIQANKKDAVAVKATAASVKPASKGITKATSSPVSAKSTKAKEVVAPAKNGKTTAAVAAIASKAAKNGKQIKPAAVVKSVASKKSNKDEAATSQSKSKAAAVVPATEVKAKAPKKGKKEIKKQSKTQQKKKEVLKLHDGQEDVLKSQLEMPRRNQFRILFSNCAVSDEEKEDMTSFGARIVKDVVNQNDFNILVTDDFKRRLKTLVALNLGYPIVSSAWVSDCVEQEKILPVEKYLLQKVDAKFKSVGFNIAKSRSNNLELEEPLLEGHSFGYSGDSKTLKKSEIKLLVESAGGVFRESLKVDYWLQANDIEADLPSHSASAKRIDLEGLLQTCLLQTNVIDKFEFGKSSSSKATNNSSSNKKK